MQRAWAIVPFIVIWIALTVLAVTWGFLYDWPDYVHIDYGHPLLWATHTLSTIAGPADKWEVNLSALATDLLFWLGLMALAVIAILYISNIKPLKSRRIYVTNLTLDSALIDLIHENQRPL